MMSSQETTAYLLCQSIDNEPLISKHQDPTNRDVINRISRNNQPFCPHCGVVPLDVSMSTTNLSSKQGYYHLVLGAVFGIAAILVSTAMLGCSFQIMNTTTSPHHWMGRRIASSNTTSTDTLSSLHSNNYLYISLSALFLLTLILAYNTYHLPNPSTIHTINPKREVQIKDALDQINLLKRRNWGDDIGMYYAQILSRLIQCKTISYDTIENHAKDSVGFDHQALQFHAILESSFPTLYKQFPPKKIATYSLVFEIIPPNQSQKNKQPILWCSHLDVVPASYTSRDDLEGWLQDPFGGKIADGCVWGRGAVDNKCNVLAQLAAIENILSSSELFHQLDRTVFVAIGHDEEIGGKNGAANISAYFSQRQLSFEYILDEGNIMVSNFIPGMKGHLALIGTIEKGMMNVELSVTGLGGHASMPPIHAEGNIQQDRRILPILLRALLALENHPCPSHFGPTSPLRRMLEIVARQRLVSFPINVVFSNFWFFGPIVQRVLTRLSAGAAASIRTTTAITRILGGEKLNSLPTKVRAYINHRVHPEDSIEGILRYDQRIINNDRVAVRLLDGSRPPSKDSGYTSSGYQCIENTVRMVFDLPSAPALVVGNTDTYWYWNLSDQIYRFLPIAMALKDATMVHGYNERIGVKALDDLVKFYETLVLLDGLQSFVNDTAK